MKLDETRRDGTRTAIILCGGRSTRFGKDKALLTISGVPMVARMADRVSCVVDEIILAARDPEQCETLADVSKMLNDAPIVCDSVAGYGPVAGVLAGLLASGSTYSVCLACDLPHVSSSVVDALFRYAEGRDSVDAAGATGATGDTGAADVVIPQHPDGMLEPLHAVYGRSMIHACRDAIEEGAHTIRSAITLVRRVVYVPTESLRRFDPGLRTFLNVNYPEDLGRVV
ncbi:MAG: molybdenum cofactor guanylyltransferase [Methanosarcinales archaeon]|nr:molybdenum cofactor guanylyltransferase [Methanosarcinales archaeon]